MCIPSKTAVSDVFEAINVDLKPIMKFKEKVNKEACLYVASLSQSDFEQFFWDEDEISKLKGEKKYSAQRYFKQAKQYCAAMINNGYEMEQTYKYGKDSGGEGRLYVDGFGLQCCQRALRGLLGRGIYTDYDMSNCHPNLLYRIAKHYKQPCAYLREYVSDRDAILEECDTDKHTMLMKMNQDKPKASNKPKLDAIVKEVAGIKDFIDKNVNVKTKNKKNRKSSQMNKLLCIVESKVLQDTFDYIDATPDDYCVPCFDGFMITKRGDVV